MKIEGDIVSTANTSVDWPSSKRIHVKRWVVAILFVTLIGGGLSYASFDAYQRMKAVRASNQLVQQGVSIDDASVSGLTKKQLEDRVGTLISRAESKMKLVVNLGGTSYTYNSKELGITFDTAATIQSAWISNKPKTLPDKLMAAYGMWHPGPKQIATHWNLTNTALVPRIAKNLSDSINRDPVDGRLELSEEFVPVITPGVDGQQVSTSAIAERMNQSIREGTFSSPIKITPMVIAAKQVTDTHSIVVNRSTHKVTLYDGSDTLKQYPCAVGQQQYPTPVGDFHITSKEVEPTWVNPNSDWSAGMPEKIVGGPDNPLGERALALDAPAVLLHGIPASEYSSIGHDASHGCIRMMPNDILDLFGRVETGTRVFIR